MTKGSSMKKNIIIFVFCILLILLMKPISEYAVSNAIKNSSDEHIQETHYYDDFWITGEQKTDRLKKLAKIMKAINKCEDYYFHFRKKDHTSSFYDKKSFFNAYNEMNTEFKTLSFKEAAEYDKTQKDINCRIFKYSKARSIAKLAALFLSIKCDDPIIAEMSDKIELIDYLETILKYSTLIENSNRTLIDKMVSNAMDKMAVKIAIAVSKVRTFTPDEIKRLNDLFTKRLEFSLNLKKIMLSELEWAGKYMAPLWNKYPIRMKIYSIFNGNPVKDYEKIINMKIKGENKAKIMAQTQKSSHLIRMIIPNFFKAEEKINEVNNLMALFKTDYSKSNLYKECSPFEPLKDFGFDWNSYGFQK